MYKYNIISIIRGMRNIAYINIDISHQYFNASMCVVSLLAITIYMYVYDLCGLHTGGACAYKLWLLSGWGW